jgi:hypothetical protein
MNRFDDLLRFAQPMTINAVFERHPMIISIGGQLHDQEYGLGDAQAGALKSVLNPPLKLS